MATPRWQKDLRKFVKKVKEVYKLTVTPRNMKSIGDEIALLIRERSRKGYGVDFNEGPQVRFQSLSEAYVARRRGYAGLSFHTSPRKSNITFTGQMLESVRTVSFSKGTAKVGPTGRRDDGRYNSVVARYVSEVRPFMYLSKPQLSQLNRFYRKLFGRAAKSKRLTFNQQL